MVFGTFAIEIMMDEGVIVLSEDEAIENSFTTDDKQAKFVEILENDKIKILLNKGQQSEVKRKKEQAMKLALAQYEVTFGRSSNEYQIRKKIHNIKTALKKKAFGQPTVLLKPWQVKFMNILNEVEEEHIALYGDSSMDPMTWSTFAPEIHTAETTPTISSVSSAQHNLNNSRKQSTHQNGFVAQSQINLKSNEIQQSRSDGDRKRQKQVQEQREYLDINSTKKLRLEEVDESYYEDEEDDDLKNPFELPETENLTMEQLQRLVLVKQLNLINIQTEREKLKLQNLLDTKM